MELVSRAVAIAATIVAATGAPIAAGPQQPAAVRAAETNEPAVVDARAHGLPPRPEHWGDCPTPCHEPSECKDGELFTGFVGRPQTCHVVNAIGVSEIEGD